MTSSPRFGCVIRSGPFGGRSGRDQLDVILAAALGGWELELFFVGPGILHLVPGKQHAPAKLPGTWRGWKSLAELGPVRVWVESGNNFFGEDADPGTLLAFDTLDTPAMAERLAACDRVMAL